MASAIEGIVPLLLALVLAACGRTVSDIEGEWQGQDQSAVQFEMSLSEDGGAVSGAGTYNISGPRPTGTFQVRGTFGPPSVALLFTYDNGTRATFNGTLETSSRLGGRKTYTTRSGEVRSETIMFFRIAR